MEHLCRDGKYVMIGVREVSEPYLDGGWCGVELSGTVVRNPDTVHSVLHRRDGVLNGHHALHNDLHCCVLSVVFGREDSMSAMVQVE
jgi:hypothetical protein